MKPPELTAPASAAAYQPDLTVATLVLRAGRLLFVEEVVRGSHVLNQPAGHVEPGETLLQAAVRETREETAWQVRPTAFVGAYQWTDPEDGRAFLRFVFVAEPECHHADQPLDSGIVRCLWLAPGEMRARRARLRSPLVERAVEDFLCGQRLPLSTVRSW